MHVADHAAQRGVLIGGICPLPQDAVPVAQRFGDGDVRAASHDPAVFHTASTAHFDGEAVVCTGANDFCTGAHPDDAGVIRHHQIFYVIVAFAQAAHTLGRQQGDNIGCSVRCVAGRGKVSVCVGGNAGGCGDGIGIFVVIECILVVDVSGFAADFYPIRPRIMQAAAFPDADCVETVEKLQINGIDMIRKQIPDSRVFRGMLIGIRINQNMRTIQHVIEVAAW